MVQRKPPIREVTRSTERVRFGAFEADLATGELRKHGIRLKLYDQPFDVLAMLIARPGELVTREELQQRLWPSGTFVDFENGLNSAINRLRDTLSDSADEPKFIETVPRRGYRFIASVESLNGNSVPVAEVTPRQAATRSKSWRWLASAVTAAVLFMALDGWRLYHPPKKPLNFSARDWVLISGFENRTGNPVFDGSVEYALERELSNSQFVYVVPRERTSDVLGLMKKPLDSKIDAALGREICLRDGGIRALLTGRVEKLGTTYVLSAQVVNPTDGVAVASLSEEDAADSQMAAAVRRLSNRVRETLGEKRALIQQGQERLEKVTTPSLIALQLYSKADELMRSQAQSEAQYLEDQGAAADLLNQALAADPNFASAHLLLAYTLANRGKDTEAKPEFQRAFDLGGTTSDRERFFINGSYYDMVQEDASQAIQSYDALLRLYPDHYWAAKNLELLYQSVGRWDDRWRLSVRLADLRPNDLHFNESAACGKFLENDPNGAKPYMERVRAIAAEDPKGPAPHYYIELLPVFYSWAQGDVNKAWTQYRQLNSSGDRTDYFFLWSLGQLADAERRLKQDSNEDVVALLGYSSYIRGDLPEAKKYFQDYKDDALVWTLLVLMGRSSLWDRVENTIRKIDPDTPGVEIIRGEHAIARGQKQTGIALLKKGIEAMHKFPIGAFYLGSETLARTYEKQGNFNAALRVLRQASHTKGRVYNCLVGPMNGAWWLRDELQLADLYREMGRVAEAEKVEDELRNMLIYADADHPILRELQKRERLVAGVPRALH